MNILVTGGCGFIGSHTVDLAIERGHKVLVIDDLSTGKRENLSEKAELVAVSIMAKGVPDIVRAFQPDAIIHLAAQPSLRKSLDDPILDARINILGTLYMLMMARECGAKLVMASTSAVYNPDGLQPYGEEDDCLPNLPYGIAKHSAELYVQNSGCPYAILRYGNVYGPRQVEVGENQLVPHCLRYLVHSVPFIINGDGLSTRDFIYVGDIARANVWAAEGNAQGVYNTATGTSVTINHVCRILAELCSETPIDFLHGAAKAGEARHVQLDCRKIHIAGWRHATELAEGLRMTAESWSKAKETA